MMKNGKYLVQATAMLVVQVAREVYSDTETPRTAFEAAIDRTMVVWRSGDVTTETTDTFVEVRCLVTYGPLWATRGDVRRHLDRLVRGYGETLRGNEVAVFNLEVTDLASTEDVTAVIERFKQQARDINVPIAKRKYLEHAIPRLQRGGSAGRVPRIAAASE